MNQTESLKVSIDGSDTQAQGAMRLQKWHLPWRLLQALRARERSVSEADGNNWQCVVIESYDI